MPKREPARAQPQSVNDHIINWNASNWVTTMLMVALGYSLMRMVEDHFTGRGDLETPRPKRPRPLELSTGPTITSKKHPNPPRRPISLAEAYKARL